MQKLPEEQRLTTARTVELRPPMRWDILRRMTDQDQRAIYRFIVECWANGRTKLDFVPPDPDPPQPDIVRPAAS